MRVLIVEDELRMAGLIRRGLVHEGPAADVAGTGEDAVWMAQAHEYDAIVVRAIAGAHGGSAHVTNRPTSGADARLAVSA